MPLPSPDNYDDWKSFARALMTALGTGADDVVAGLAINANQAGNANTVTIPPLPPVPDGWVPIWADESTAQLYFANPFFDPPDAGDIVQIDTVNLALASVELNTIADNAVSTAKIINLAVINAKIADATILSAKIGNLQVVTAAINTLAVNQAKIANLAVGSAQIINAAILTAHIGLAQVLTAQIGSAQITTALIGTAQVNSAHIIDASIATADIGAAQITTALIQNAAITNALILNGTILTADIGAAQITSALIAAAQILTAHIADAQISSAKITDLVVSKITAGTLDAVIDVGAGLLRFTIGGNRLSIGKGFGTSSQFIMWFGPSMAENLMTEAAAVFYLKTDGSAYFGGSLLAGTLTNSATTSSLSSSASVSTAAFGSNGAERVYTVSYVDTQSLDWTTGNMTKSGTYTATVKLEADYGSGFVTLDAGHVFTGSAVIDNTDKTYRASNSGSFTYTDSSGGVGPITLRATITSRTDFTLGGGFGGAGSFFESQRLSVLSVEE